MVDGVKGPQATAVKEAVRRAPKGAPGEEAWLRRVCPRVVDGIQRLCRWIENAGEVDGAPPPCGPAARRGGDEESESEQSFPAS